MQVNVYYISMNNIFLNISYKSFKNYKYSDDSFKHKLKQEKETNSNLF